METAKGKSREEIINRLAARIDSFENYTCPHAHLMADLAAHLSRRLGLAQPDISAIIEAALLHDIGLYAMTPAYHLTPGPLSFEERMDLWRHPIIGEQQMAKRDGMRHAQLLVRWHHEWWNGSGYPDMLGFEDIPIGARILRAVELFNSLISDRPYRAALNREQALETLKASAGIECDPYIVKALAALLEDIHARAAAAEPAVTTDLTANAEEPRGFTQGVSLQASLFSQGREEPQPAAINPGNESSVTAQSESGALNYTSEAREPASGSTDASAQTHTGEYAELSSGSPEIDKSAATLEAYPPAYIQEAAQPQPTGEPSPPHNTTLRPAPAR
ncbi:MAG TPA: HD domain-containing phosphohydrolase, partial [Blastocatellia bacterium]